MPKAKISADDIDALLARGLRNKWHPLCPSRFIEDRPIALKRAGERLVLWRDREGTLHIQDDRCPHRGAPLSIGRHLGDRLGCTYHGLEVAGDGTVAAMPAMPDCPLVGEKAVRTFPSTEFRGSVFAYFGDALHPDPVPFTPAEQLTSDDYDAFHCYAEWNIPYRYALDNVLDPMHGAFLHAQSHSMASGQSHAKMTLNNTERGFIFEKADQHDVNFDWVEWCDAGMSWMHLEIPYPKTGGPGGNFGIIAQCTPIDDTTAAFTAWRYRKVKGWQRDIWRFLYKNRLEGRHWDVLEQDRFVLEAMGAEANKHEYLYQHDLALARVRRDMRKQAEAQLAALAAARAGAKGA